MKLLVMLSSLRSALTEMLESLREWIDNQRYIKGPEEEGEAGQALISDGGGGTRWGQTAGGSSYEIGDGLKLDEETNTLSVDTAEDAEEDNIKPITSAAVYSKMAGLKDDIPRKTSELMNDSGFITAGDIPANDIPAVLYTAQTLTDLQKEKARENIGGAQYCTVESSFSGGANWYRVGTLKRSKSTSSAILQIGGSYSYNEPTAATLLINIGYDTYDIRQLGSAGPNLNITKVRVVKSSASEHYIDVYHSKGVADYGQISVLPILGSFTPGTLSVAPTSTAAAEFSLVGSEVPAYFVNPVKDGVASYTVTSDTIGKTIRLVSGSTDYVINIVGDSSIPVGSSFEILHQWSKSSKIVFSNNASVMLEGGTGVLSDHTITLPKGFYTVSLQKYVSGSGGDHWFVRVGGNKPTTLWSGSWVSGSITVPGLSNYKLFSISTVNNGNAQGTNVIASIESDKYLRGMGGYPLASSGSAWTSVIQYYVSVEASGDTLTFKFAKTSGGDALSIDRIDGLV